MIRSADEFVQLRTSDDPAEYNRAGHEEADISTWLDVIKRYPDYRRWVAYNKTVPIEILEILAQDSSWRVRHAVAGKNKLTPALLEKLAVDPDEGVRARIARHKKISPDLLRRIVTRDSSEFVREVAQEQLDKLG